MKNVNDGTKVKRYDGTWDIIAVGDKRGEIYVKIEREGELRTINLSVAIKRHAVQVIS